MYAVKSDIANQLHPLAGLDTTNIVQMIEYPPNPELGDLALPCFKFAKAMRKSPTAIAETFASVLEQLPSVAEAVATNGYLNIRLNREDYAKQIVGRSIRDVHEVFSADRNHGHTAAVDYSSPNIAKPFGVGHLRSTIIGESIVRMLREDGYRVVGVNHLGDWGTQFGKTIAAYLRWGDEATVRANPVKELFKLYVKFHEEAEKDPALEDEGRYWFKQLEDGNQQAVDLWQWFIDESLKAFKETYHLLGVSFDHYLGESFYNDKMDAVVAELREKQLLVRDAGAEVVSLADYDMPPCIIRKSDGTSIYATRDLAAADYRHFSLGADTLVYVVGAEQKLHFQQLFRVLGLMGRTYADSCFHVSFGMMKYNGERLSTRRGHVVYLEDVLATAISEARKIIDEKNPSLPNKDAVAKSVGVGAVVFNDLKTYRAHDVDFQFEDVLNFDGETGPYVQYTHARASSVLRKSGVSEADIAWTDSELSDYEWQLVFTLGQANEALNRAVDEYDPSVMARYALQICHMFNRFYHHSPILQAEGDKRMQRLALTLAAKQVLAKALDLVGIDAPIEM